MLYPATLEDRLDYIRERIQIAATHSGRKQKHITLVAITKKFPMEIWERAINVNLTTLGESSIQEAEKKVKVFPKRNKIKLHFIGHLQSNKARKAVDIFDVIQTVDSLKLAEKIDYISKEKQKEQSLFLQINTGEDPKKFGISTNQALHIAEKITKMKNLRLDGVMTIPRQGLTVTELSSVYRKTRKIRDNIRTKINKYCSDISMGMSNDYEIAIEEGATHIRIGTGLFGERIK